MDERGYNQYRLHKLSGFTKTQISEWQHGKHRPSLSSVRRLAITLRLPFEDLKSQLEVRESYQNALNPDGQFVARSRENSIAIGETNDATRTDGVYCLTCHRKLDKAA